jgi:hypothetical protein
MNLAAKLLTTAAGVALLTLETGETAQAAILAQRTFDIRGGLFGPGALIRDDINLTLSIRDELNLPPFFFFTPSLFEDIVVTPSDVGKIFTASQATDPDFNSFVEILKGSSQSTVTNYAFYFNQNNQREGFGTGVGAGPEVASNVSSFASSGAGPIDFSGYTINSISLQIDSLTITNAGQSASIDFVSTVRIEGEESGIPTPVPEPSSVLATGAIFGAGLVLKRRQKRA